MHTLHFTRPVPRVALVGISGYGRVYLNYLEPALIRGELQLVAAVVINRTEEREACERLKARGVQLYSSWQEMLHDWAGQLDLCLLPVPIHLHEEIVVAALHSGANVLVEKPLAGGIKQAQAIQKAERATGRWVAVGYQDFYSPATQAIRFDLASGRIGTVRSIRWMGLRPRSEAYYSRNGWSGRLRVDGLPVLDSPLNNAMAHFLNLSLYWSGTGETEMAWPASVKAELFRCFPIESFDTAVMHLVTNTGVKIQIAATHCCPVEHPIHLVVHGDNGELGWVHRKQAVWTSRDGKSEKIVLQTADEVFASMMQTVLARLHSPEFLIFTTTMAMSHVKCIEMLHDATPIRTVAPAHVEEKSMSDSTGLVIRNIEQDFNHCLSRELLPSEIGAEWAQPSQEEKPTRRRRDALRTGFTLVELLVTIGIIAILCTLVMMNGHTIQVLMRRTQGASNLRQVGMALSSYTTEHNGQLPGPCNLGIYPYYQKGGAYGSTYMFAASLATYMGLPEAVTLKSTTQKVIVPALVCPGFKAFFNSDPTVTINFVQNCEVPNIPYGVPFGTSAYTPDSPPLTMAAIAAVGDPATIWAITNADQKLTAKSVRTSGWFSKLPPNPVYGNVRLRLYFDGHVAVTPITEPSASQ